MVFQKTLELADQIARDSEQADMDMMNQSELVVDFSSLLVQMADHHWLLNMIISQIPMLFLGLIRQLPCTLRSYTWVYKCCSADCFFNSLGCVFSPPSKLCVWRETPTLYSKLRKCCCKGELLRMASLVLILHCFSAMLQFLKVRCLKIWTSILYNACFPISMCQRLWYVARLA